MASQRQYYDLMLGPARHYRDHKGFMLGRVSSEDNFTRYRKPDLDASAAPVPEGDFIAVPDAPMHYLSIDPSGVLAWEKNEITYFETTAHVVEILSGKAGNAYKDFLRRRKVSYIIAGEDALDLDLAVRKIGQIFGMSEIVLGGGGGINWSFVQAGLCDELSIVLTPAADGRKDAQTLFEADDRYTAAIPTSFKLREVQPLADGSLWLRYAVTGPIG